MIGGHAAGEKKPICYRTSALTTITPGIHLPIVIRARRHGHINIRHRNRKGSKKNQTLSRIVPAPGHTGIRIGAQRQGVVVRVCRASPGQPPVGGCVRARNQILNDFRGSYDTTSGATSFTYVVATDGGITAAVGIRRAANTT